MVTFAQTVAMPSTSDYAPPTPDIFSQIANLPNAYFQGQFNKQRREMNDQRIAAAQRQAALAQAFPNGLPMKDGVLDAETVGNTFAKFGAPLEAAKLLQQQPAPVPDFLKLPGQAPAAPPVSNTADKIIQVESGGDPNAKNPNSSASGLGQFTDSTWLDTIKKHLPNLAQGRTDEQLLRMRQIPQLARRMTEAFTADNEAGLAKAGLPVTPATTYLAHFAGLGGAIKVLKADPDAPVSDVLDARAIKANPFLKGMTVRDLQSWAARKMVGPAMVAQNAVPAGGSGAEAGARLADASGSLPPSANAGTPAAQPAPPQSAPNGAGSGRTAPPITPQAAPPVQQGAPQAQQPQAPVQQPQPQPQAAAPVAPPLQSPPQALAAARQPLVPMPELPHGFTDPNKAIGFLRNYERANASNPKTQANARQAGAWADRIEKAISPMHVGSSIVNPQTSETIYSAARSAGGQAGHLVNLENAEREARGERPMTAQEEIAFIQGIRPPRSAPAMAVEAFRRDFQARNGRLPTGEEIQDFQASGVGKSTAERVRAGREENLNLILRATKAAIPAAIDASKALPRSNYVPLNRLIQRGQVMSSNPQLVEFGQANLQLAEHWARAMNPTGVMRESDRDKALHFLDTAYGNKTYERAVRQLEKQIEREQAAVRGGGTTVTGDPVPGAEAKSEGAAGKVSADGFHIYDTDQGKVRVKKIGND